MKGIKNIYKEFSEKYSGYDSGTVYWQAENDDL